MKKLEKVIYIQIGSDFLINFSAKPTVLFLQKFLVIDKNSDLKTTIFKINFIFAIIVI